MKKGALIGTILLILIASISAETIINEVELNPQGEDNGNEWLEIYSDSFQSLNRWKLINSRNEIKNLNGDIKSNNYLVINFNEQWLNNENETIKLIDSNGAVVFQTPILKDTFNDDKSWNHCNSSWSLLASSRGFFNNCVYQSSTQDNNKNPAKIELELDDEIRNGEAESTENVIYLNTESIKSNKNITYESKNEKIKRYSVYAFIFFIAILIILFLLRVL